MRSYNADLVHRRICDRPRSRARHRATRTRAQCRSHRIARDADSVADSVAVPPSTARSLWPDVTKLTRGGVPTKSKSCLLSTHLNPIGLTKAALPAMRARGWKEKLSMPRRSPPLAASRKRAPIQGPRLSSKGPPMHCARKSVPRGPSDSRRTGIVSHGLAGSVIEPARSGDRRFRRHGGRAAQRERPHRRHAAR